MRRSEIFENFVKIAQEKGLISEAEHAEHTEKSFSETNPRHDSLSIEQIGKLYNTKPELPEGMEYKKNIMEDAHPEPAVVSPSHDKLNGLVENNIERQNILLHIVNKTPDGHLTQRKYAHKNLLLSLVRVANELDNSDHEELRKLADVCLEQASKKKIKKTAQWQIIVGAVAAVIGGLYLQQHLPDVNKGFDANSDALLDEIRDFQRKQGITLGVGVKYKQDFLELMEDFASKVENFKSVVDTVLPVVESIEKPHTAQELMQIAQKPETNQIQTAYQNFRKAYIDFRPYIAKIFSDFGSEDYKMRQIEEKGTFTEWLDAPQILHGGSGLIKDDFDDVRKALEPYRKSIIDIANVLRGTQSIQESAKQQLATSLSGAGSELPELSPEGSAGAPTTTPTGTAKPTKEESTVSSIENEIKGLTGGLFGG